MIGELTGAISYLFFVRQLAAEIESNWSAVLEKLEQIRGLLVNREVMLGNVTLDEANWKGFAPQLEELLGALPSAPVTMQQWSPATFPAHEGMTMPTQVNSVGKAANLYAAGYRPHHSSSVIAGYLRTTWMWDKVRMQGGAYGAFCSMNPASGIFTLLSSQDPNLLGTIDTYDQTSQFLRQLELSPQELTRSIIGAISDMDRYQLPDAKGWSSLQRYLMGETDELRQQHRDEVLGTTVADFRAFADVLESVKEQGHTVVIGSPDAVATANSERGNWMEVFPIA
jgi:Zn-dependent M16 (insulinase) family peptidase